MGNKIFAFTCGFILMVVLFFGGHAYAEGTKEPEVKQVEMSIKEAIVTEGKQTNEEKNSLDIANMKEQIQKSSNEFSIDGAVEKAQNISLYMLIAWIIISGILFFFMPRVAIGVAVLGLIGYGVVNHPIQIAGAFHGLIDWIFSV